MNLKEITIDISGTFHVLNEAPLYPHRFQSVLKFHPPGLAPACDATGAFHINREGRAIYPQRYRATFGFYDHLAAVEQDTAAWHIHPDGARAYPQSYVWCGNFQEKKCVVRNEQGLFFHIYPDGTPVYHNRYLYAGDYRDGYAVVKRDDGQSTHIDAQGALAHHRWYGDLDVFHKGYARCRDASGWFHIDTQGNPAYTQRYQDVEPFYNGLAYATTPDQKKVLIDSTGHVRHTVDQPINTVLSKVSGHLTQYWESFALVHFLQLDILGHLPTTLTHLASILQMPQENLKRLLALIEEMGYVQLAQDQVFLSPAGQDLQSTPFLKDAATLWSRLAQEWLGGMAHLRKITQGFAHFKSKETCAQASAAYQRALEGYGQAEIPSSDGLAALHRPSHQKVLFVGRQGIPWAVAFKSHDPDIEITVYLEKWDQEPTHPDNYPFSVTYLSPDQGWPTNSFDAIYLVKSLMAHTACSASMILKEAVRCLTPAGDLWIVEPMVGANGSVAGLNLNMLYECGGEVRTLSQWQALLKAADLSILAMYASGFNTLLNARATAAAAG